MFSRLTFAIQFCFWLLHTHVNNCMAVVDKVGQAEGRLHHHLSPPPPPHHLHNLQVEDVPHRQDAQQQDPNQSDAVVRQNGNRVQNNPWLTRIQKQRQSSKNTKKPDAVVRQNGDRVQNNPWLTRIQTQRQSSKIRFCSIRSQLNWKWHRWMCFNSWIKL